MEPFAANRPPKSKGVVVGFNLWRWVEDLREVFRRRSAPVAESDARCEAEPHGAARKVLKISENS
jgi:hypothetical protein